jgi:hypothetical protein
MARFNESLLEKPVLEEVPGDAPARGGCDLLPRAETGGTLGAVEREILAWPGRLGLASGDDDAALLV